ncbi:hypothetical protein EKO04_004389 [Ascochyta lentis]|uniref:Trichothecene 3-O-acetyltransferase n=1 Tax=Ascochyta lentis TaxID=205686 RepID=A0A8H7J7M4_9PLEO|nr:hypothetical protein EKO04_004389 [Ascochyta lentis]
MATKSSTLDLTILDQTMLRVYVRQLLIFPFPDTDHQADALSVLHAGLFEVFQHYPFLAGTIRQTNPLTGAMTVDYPDKIDSDLPSQLLKVNKLDDQGLGYDYDKLCEEGLPPSKLPSDVLCPFALVGHPGMDDAFAEGLTTFVKDQPIPVFAAQVTFIPGGLILSAYTHHSVVDGTGIAKIYQTWSASTRAYSNRQPTAKQASTYSLNTARNVLDSLIVDAQPMDLPEFRYPDTPVLVPLLRESPYKISAKIFVFSASRIFQLANSLSNLTHERISTFTALTALVWCQITNARRAVLIEKGIQKTTVGIAIDQRKRVGSLLPANYIGNCANGMTVSLLLSSIPTTETMDNTSIAAVALALSNRLGEINLDWFRARLLHMSEQPNSSKLVLNVDTCNGPDLFITSWMHIGADDVWAVPGTAKMDNETWGCKPTAIRKPQCASEGGIQILPRRKGGEAPFETLVCLEDGEMERTMKSLGGGKWVEKFVEG